MPGQEWDSYYLHITMPGQTQYICEVWGFLLKYRIEWLWVDWNNI